MRGFVAGLIGFTLVVGALVLSWIVTATWEATARDSIDVYAERREAMYEGPADKAPRPSFGVRINEPVWVLWDFRERGYWTCLMQLPDGRRGWGSCRNLKPK